MKNAVFAVLIGCSPLCAAAPLAAQTLPDGEFMLGTYIWPDTHLARYVTLLVDGPRIDVEFSSAIALNGEECRQTGTCSYSVIGAQALSGITQDTLHLSQIDIAAEAVTLLDDGGYGASYVEPFLALIEGATLTETDTGLTLTRSGQTLEFYETDAAARAAIRAYPIYMETSIADLAGCEVRTLAPILAEQAPSPGIEAFQHVLAGMAHQVALHHRIDSLLPFGSDPAPEDQENARTLQLASGIPNMVAMMGFGSDAAGIAAFWNEMGDGMFNGDRATFDAAMADYGEGFSGLVLFLQHLRERGGPSPADQICDDPSFGLIAAQGG